MLIESRSFVMKVVCIVQARVGSTRLPGKVLKKICGKTVLEHDIDRLKRAKNIDEIVIATTTEERDIEIVNEAKRLGVKYYRGSESDVLSRYYFAAKENNADIVVRVTSDCPLLDSEVTEEIIKFYLENYPKYDYVSNTLDRTYPRGLDTEVFSFKVLEEAFLNAKENFQREHVTPYMWDNNTKYKVYQYKDIADSSNLRLTLDTQEDFKLITEIYIDLYNNNQYFGLKEILNLFNERPELIEINKEIQQKKIK
jgi:spore coat polysaccharide biosynthesis protein SpsF